MEILYSSATVSGSCEWVCVKVLQKSIQWIVLFHLGTHVTKIELTGNFLQFCHSVWLMRMSLLRYVSKSDNIFFCCISLHSYKLSKFNRICLIEKQFVEGTDHDLMKMIANKHCYTSNSCYRHNFKDVWFNDWSSRLIFQSQFRDLWICRLHTYFITNCNKIDYKW